MHSKSDWVPTSTVKGHPPCPRKVVLFKPSAVDDLLRQNITAAEQDLEEVSDGIELLLTS